jgi:uncharacterized protein YjbI with pentapeptide repeats
MTKLRTMLVVASMAALQGVVARVPVSRADIFQWEYINPANPSLGTQQSATLAPDGAGVSAIPGVNLSNRDLTKAYLISAMLSPYVEYDLEGNLIEYRVANLTGANLSQADLTHAGSFAANFANANLSQANLTNAIFVDYVGDSWINYTDFTGANLSQANLTGAAFGSAILTGANLSGAEVRGARFAGFSQGDISPAQLYSTASYQARDLTGINFRVVNLAGIDLAGQNLTNAVLQGNFRGADFSHAVLVNADLSNRTNLSEANFSHANLTNANFAGIEACGETCGVDPGAYFTDANLSGADTRGANFNLTPLYGAASYRNMIWSGGWIGGLDLTSGASLVVRDYDGKPDVFPPIGPILVFQHAMMDATGTLQLILEADAWDSTVSFAPGIPVTLGGTLELAFATGVDLASQIGRTIDLFDWTGVTPTGAFTISSPYTWDLTNLYTTGEVTLLAAASLSGDYNDDGTVDAADYTVWRDSFGGNALINRGVGIIGPVGTADYEVWKANFGQSFGTGSDTTPAIPEPAAMILVLAALVCGLATSRPAHFRQ